MSDHFGGDLRNEYNNSGGYQPQQYGVSDFNQRDSDGIRVGTHPQEALGEAQPKKRSRWGAKVEDPPVDPQQQYHTCHPLQQHQQQPLQSGDGNAGGTPAKKSRWGAPPPGPAPMMLPGVGMVTLPGTLSAQQAELMVVQAKIKQINTLLLTPNLGIDQVPDGERSPSPEPIYDKNGIRTNTRLNRKREKLTKELEELVTKAQNLDPSFRPAVNIKFNRKKEKKILIPIDKYPDYNFFGIIVGPRGNTQKRLERETGAKIAIRGKGANKMGKKSGPGDDEPLHVYITAETQEALEKAADIIEKLLIPVEEGKNDHKAKQLRELAAINGTLRDEVICRVCGERGHKIYECKNRTGASWTPANVLCTICGATSHPTVDCPNKTTQDGKPVDTQQLNAEYVNFLNEIAGGAGSANATGGLLSFNGNDYKGSAPTNSTSAPAPALAPSSAGTAGVGANGTPAGPPDAVPPPLQPLANASLLPSPSQAQGGNGNYVTTSYGTGVPAMDNKQPAPPPPGVAPAPGTADAYGGYPPSNGGYDYSGHQGYDYSGYYGYGGYGYGGYPPAAPVPGYPPAAPAGYPSGYPGYGHAGYGSYPPAPAPPPPPPPGNAGGSAPTAAPAGTAYQPPPPPPPPGAAPTSAYQPPPPPPPPGASE